MMSELTQDELNEAMLAAKERDTRRWKFRIPFYVSFKKLVREFDPNYSGWLDHVGLMLVDYTIEISKQRVSANWTGRDQEWRVTTSYKHVRDIWARSVCGRRSEVKKYWHSYETPENHAANRKNPKRLRNLAVDDAVAGIDRYTRAYLNRRGRILVWWLKKKAK